MNKENNKKKAVNGEKNKKKKTLKIILAVLLVFLLIVVIVAVWFVNHKLNLISYENESTTIPTNQEFIDNEDETLNFSEMDDATGNDYKSILKNWATNGGEKMKSKKVINVLLIGSDASTEYDGRSGVTEKGNTDVMMLASVNKETKKIKLISFMRDSYTYMAGYDMYAKLNAACSNGGPEFLLETIENDYKIEIDGYALVDFDSFREVINIIGGVRVNVPKYVANYLNEGKHPQYKTIPSGDDVLLDGDQALAFCRIRKSDADGDVSRVARQREVISYMIEECKNSSLSEINDIIDVVLANVRTNIGKKTILNYATQAITNGWAGYEIEEITMPTPDARYGYSGSSWIWVIDYPLVAQKLQNELYGTTNIHLEENRKTAITVMGGHVTK